MNHISSENLSASDLPRPNAKWERITKFASTFDIQNEMVSGSQIRSVFDVTRSSSIPDLRCALYVDWRRFNHVGDFLTEGTFEKSQEIVEWLREKLQSNT